MMPFDEREQERLSFLYELYKRSAGDARQGVPYEDVGPTCRHPSKLATHSSSELSHSLDLPARGFRGLRHPAASTINQDIQLQPDC
jgi:hypothetical protein